MSQSEIFFREKYSSTLTWLIRNTKIYIISEFCLLSRDSNTSYHSTSGLVVKSIVAIRFTSSTSMGPAFDSRLVQFVLSRCLFCPYNDDHCTWIDLASAIDLFSFHNYELQVFFWSSCYSPITHLSYDLRRTNALPQVELTRSCYTIKTWNRREIMIINTEYKV